MKKVLVPASVSKLAKAEVISASNRNININNSSIDKLKANAIASFTEAVNKEVNNVSRIIKSKLNSIKEIKEATIIFEPKVLCKNNVAEYKCKVEASLMSETVIFEKLLDKFGKLLYFDSRHKSKKTGTSANIYLKVSVKN